MLVHPSPLVISILDGFGHRLETENNAIAMVGSPCLDRLYKENPVVLLNCSGSAAGVPDDQMGNSEAGRLHALHTTNSGSWVYVGADRALFEGGGLSDPAPV